MKTFHLVFVLPAIVFSSTNQSSCDENTGTCLNSPNNIEYYVEKRNRLHPMVQLLSERSTSMAAKFRSLSGRNLQIYWDDGREGVEQAFLSPGMISTLNTYEGHTFFATPEDDKTKVLNRFTISKEKVSYQFQSSLLFNVISCHHSICLLGILHNRGSGSSR
jgi:hypothetical protein